MKNQNKKQLKIEKEKEANNSKQFKNKKQKVSENAIYSKEQLNPANNENKKVNKIPVVIDKEQEIIYIDSGDDEEEKIVTTSKDINSWEILKSLCNDKLRLNEEESKIDSGNLNKNLTNTINKKENLKSRRIKDLEETILDLEAQKFRNKEEEKIDDIDINIQLNAYKNLTPYYNKTPHTV